MDYAELELHEIVKLSKQIEEEIAQHKDDPTFLPQYYREYRLKGYSPDKIDYDMCHIWR